MSSDGFGLSFVLQFTYSSFTFMIFFFFASLDFEL